MGGRRTMGVGGQRRGGWETENIPITKRNVNLMVLSCFPINSQTVKIHLLSVFICCFLNVLTTVLYCTVGLHTSYPNTVIHTMEDVIWLKVLATTRWDPPQVWSDHSRSFCSKLTVCVCRLWLSMISVLLRSLTGEAGCSVVKFVENGQGIYTSCSI